MPNYPEQIVGSEEIPVLVQALIKAYEQHIETLKNRIKELESNKTLAPVGPPLDFVNPPVRHQIRTTSELARLLEERSKIRNVEVKSEDVK